MKCVICGGTAGVIPEEGHYLCQERKKLGLPTPNLGCRCPDCNGAGTTGKGGGVMLFTDIGPAAIKRSIDAQFPPCEQCGGKGYVEETGK